LRLELELDAGVRGEKPVQLRANVAIEHALADEHAVERRVFGLGRPAAV